MSDVEVNSTDEENKAIVESFDTYTLDHDKEKYTPTDINNINLHIIKLLEKLPSKPEVVIATMEYTKRSRAQCNRYYDKALELLEDETRKQVSLIRHKRLRGLEEDLKEANTRYKMADTDRDALAWFNVYLGIKSQIDSYYPNKLQMKDDVTVDENGAITVNYTEVGLINE